MKSEFVYNQPAWLILVCVIVGLIYAAALYFRESKQTGYLKYILAGIRAALVALICFLLVNPLLRSYSNRSIKPVLVIGLDDSKSMNSADKESLKSLNAFIENAKEDFEDSDYELVIKNISAEDIENADSIKFNDRKTDLGAFFRKIENEFEGQNLKKVILLSDGIANTGITPTNSNFSYSVETVGVGDTTIKKDISLKGLTANKLAYRGNDFTLKVDVSAKLSSGQNSVVRVLQNNETLRQQNVTFKNDDDFQQLTFKLPAKDIGKQRYQVQVLPISGESNTRNNTRDLIIDIIDGKEKVMILANSPHPDVKALRGILEKNELMEVTAFNLQFDDQSKIMGQDFDLLILHQLPSKTDKNSVVSRLLAKMKPTFFVLGAQTDLNLFNGMQEVLGIAASGNKTDLVTGTENTSFNRFQTSGMVEDVLNTLPPINSPFGTYRPFPGSDIVLYQKVGSVITERPLLAINTSANRKAAVLAAEGLWQWRLEEYFENEEHAAIDEIILKTAQLIAVKDDKNKLRVYPTQNVLNLDETVEFQSELYNDLFEKIPEGKINLKIKGPSFDQTFEYEVSAQNSLFSVRNLEPGVYSFTANATILGKPEESRGQFIIRDIDLESINTTADFNVLRSISEASGGSFYELDQLDEMVQSIQQEDVPSRLVSVENLKEIINLKWLLPLLLLLATIEWGIRKYKGSY
ncbi:VWA domain-containing protein [Jiulongibacter sp. NS-SX5]|uniref:VWA domain-containing protein n=1 Tax=Jiulongibacter sp. NS-SX5 TaxID=3463854 RepID=UPI0040588491